MRSAPLVVLGAGIALVTSAPLACGGGGDGTAGGKPDAAGSGGSGGTQGVDGSGWPDSPGSDGADAAADGAPGADADDGASDAGDAADAPVSNGCSSGVRRGFSDLAAWPNVAACGDPVGYADAVTNAATVCEQGWHFCTAADLGALSGPTPDFVSPGTGAWVHHDSQSTSDYAQCSDAACATSVATSNLAGTAACTVGGVYPEGWRLAVTASSWPGSHATELGCIAHAQHACGYPGGSVSVQTFSIACCKG